MTTNGSQRLGAILASTLMAFAGLGDTVLYILLPVYHQEIGVSLGWVGFLLSINRIIRISTNTWVSNKILQIGPKQMIIITSSIAVISTIAYGAGLGLLCFIIARVLWGISYSGLKISTLYYASNVKKNQSMTFGLLQGIKSLGAILALVIGPVLTSNFGIKTGLYLLALISSIGIFLSFLLPNVSIKNLTKVEVRKTFSFSPINLLVGAFALAIDGILVVSLAHIFYKPEISQTELLAIIAFYVMLKKILIVGVSTFVGILSMRIDSNLVFAVSIILCINSLALIAFKHQVVGVILAFCANAVIVSFAPLMAIHNNANNRLQQISGVTNWWDLGAGIGAFIGIQAIKSVGSFNLFLLLTVMSTVLFINYILRNEISNRTLI